MKETFYPSLYQTANSLASGAQRNFFVALGFGLFFLLAAAISSTLPSSTPVAIIQTTILAANLFVTFYIGYFEPQKAWYAQRALAESIKTITWLYMMRAEPYDIPNTEARQLFLVRLKGILKENSSVFKESPMKEGANQISKFMENIRDKSLDERKRFYKQKRIADQLGWYKEKSNFNQKKDTYFFRLLIAITLAAIFFSILKIWRPSYQFSDVFITFASLIMVWVQAKRYKELSATYSLTTYEIGLISEKFVVSTSEEEFSAFINDAESAFSREHTQWLARYHA